MRSIERLIKIVVGMMIGIALVAVVVSEFIKQERGTNLKPVLKKARKIIVRKSKPVSRVSNEKTLTERQMKIVSILKAKKQLTADDLAARIRDVNVRSIRRDLAKLSDLRLIEKNGSTKGTFYKLK